MVKISRVSCQEKVPLLVLFGLVGFLLYCYFDGYVVQSNLGSLDISILMVVGASALLGLASLVICAVSDPGTVPHDFSVEGIPEDSLQKLEASMVEIDHCYSKVTFCTHCANYRPHRAHHCRVCRKCVLRFDHHCVWVGNCVGYRNHKAFVLFLLYLGVSAGVVGAQTASKALDQPSWKLVFCGVFGNLAFLGLVCFGCFHLCLAAKNKTTLETKLNFNVFDTQSLKTNFTQVFGASACLWFVPSLNSECLIFPVRIRKKSGGCFLVKDKYIL